MVTRGPATPPATTNEPFHGTGAPNHQSGAKPAGQDLRETQPDAAVTGDGMPGGSWRCARAIIDWKIAYNNIGGVPEPTSWAMLITGFGVVGAAARRRRAVVA